MGPSASLNIPINVDLLHARVECEVVPPAAIAFVSSTVEDGQEIVARALAYSLANAGYVTLFLDTCLEHHRQTKAPQRLTLEEAGRQVTPDQGEGKLTVLNLGDVLSQQNNNQRNMQSALEMFRSKFDYVIINTEYGGLTRFAASVIATVDAVLVTVKKGRREKADDTRLSAALQRIGSNFLGVVALDASTIKKHSTIASVPDAVPNRRHIQTAQVGKDHKSRESVEWPR